MPRPLTPVGILRRGRAKRRRLGGLFGLTLAAVAALATSAGARVRKPDAPLPVVLPRAQAFTPFAWLVLSLEGPKKLELSPRDLPALARFLRPSENHTPEWRSFFEGPYGWRLGDGFRLSWSGERQLEPAGASFPSSLSLELPSFHDPLLSALSTSLALPAPPPDVVPLDDGRPCAPWARAPKVRVMRYVGESEHLSLLDCEGAVPADVLDRLSSLARAPDAPRPSLPLSHEPSPLAQNGEWTPGLHLLHPRLIWALSRIGAAFPGHAIVIMSGYRPDAHTSLHRVGRALDIYVQGVPHEILYGVCHSLRDVGCGFYPNGKFVHVDVRPFGTGHVEWVDLSRPGEPSKYADGWPGLIEPGRAWLGR